MNLKLTIGLIILVIEISSCGLIGTEGKITSKDFPKDLDFADLVLRKRN